MAPFHGAQVQQLIEVETEQPRIMPIDGVERLPTHEKALERETLLDAKGTTYDACDTGVEFRFGGHGTSVRILVGKVVVGGKLLGSQGADKFAWDGTYSVSISAAGGHENGILIRFMQPAGHMTVSSS